MQKNAQNMTGPNAVPLEQWERDLGFTEKNLGMDPPVKGWDA